MRNYQIAKKVFFLTVFLLIADAVVFFLFDALFGAVVLGYGVIFYLPLALLLSLIDRFYFKNINSYLRKLVILICILVLIIIVLQQAYFNSVFGLL
jgi:small-conductance mechanosensitive channel